MEMSNLKEEDLEYLRELVEQVKKNRELIVVDSETDASRIRTYFNLTRKVVMVAQLTTEILIGKPSFQKVHLINVQSMLERAFDGKLGKSVWKLAERKKNAY